MEEDPTKNCTNYPNEKFESYNACDDNFLNKALPPSLVPICATNNISLVTKNIYLPKFPQGKYDFVDLFDGTQISTCLLPCTTVYVESRLLTESVTPENVSKIDIYFNPHVTVTTTDFIKFIFANLLSEIGGGLGLWLGLGLMQMVEVFSSCVSPLCKGIKDAHK